MDIEAAAATYEEVLRNWPSGELLDRARVDALRYVGSLRIRSLEEVVTSLLEDRSAAVRVMARRTIDALHNGGRE